jgi:urease accessory protein
MDGALGLAGHRCIATLFFAAGSDIARAKREAALDAARVVIEAHALRETAGATAPGPRVLAVRVLAPVVEPALDLLKAVRDAWRPLLWEMAAVRPRTWAL